MIVRLIATALLLCATGFASSPAMASTPVTVPTATASVEQAFVAAVDALLARIGTAESASPAIGMDDAAVRAQFSAIDAGMSQLGTAAFPVDGYATFETICSRLNQVGIRYVMDGLPGIRPAGGGVPDQSAMTRLSLSNAIRFQGELSIILDGSLNCFAHHMPPLAAMVAAFPPGALTPERIEGLRGMRRGITGMILGQMITARDAGLRAATRERAARSTAQWIVPLVRQLSVGERRALADQIVALQPAVAADLAPHQATVLTALASTECVELCAIE